MASTMHATPVDSVTQEPSDPRQLYLLPKVFYIYPDTFSPQKEDQTGVEEAATSSQETATTSKFSWFFSLSSWKRAITILRSPSELQECIGWLARRVSGPLMWRFTQRELAKDLPESKKLFPDAYRVEYGFEEQRVVPSWRIKWTVDLLLVDEDKEGRLRSNFPAPDDIFKLENMQWIWESRQLPHGYTIQPPTGPVRVNRPRW